MVFEDRKHIDSVKGVLIVLVVLGHSVLASEYGNLKTFIYSFHVYAFLLIPFVLSNRVFTRDNLLDTAVRYLVPYSLIVLFFSIPYGWLQSYSIQQWFWFYIRGVLTGNDVYLKATSGLFLFWFLPVIFWVNILLYTYNRVHPMGKILLFLVFAIAHLVLPAMPWEQKQYYPYGGTHIALYVMPIGVLLWHACRTMDFAFCRRAKFLWLLGFVVLVALMYVKGSALSLAHLGCPSYRAPLRVVIHDLIPIFALFTLIGFSKELAIVPYLVSIGRKSLCIYLFSQPAVVAVRVLYGRWLGLDSWGDIFLCTSLSMISGVTFGYVVASVIEIWPTLKALLLPRSHNELSQVIRSLVRLPSPFLRRSDEKTYRA